MPEHIDENAGGNLPQSPAAVMRPQAALTEHTVLMLAADTALR